MKIATGNRRRNIIIIAIVGLIIAVFAATIAAAFLSSKFVTHRQSVVRASEEKRPFPDIDTFGLTVRQQKIIALLKQEYAAQEPGMKYSEGASEPWCADFVSWIMREAGSPLENSNSGSWRIPGVGGLGRKTITTGCRMLLPE